MTYRINTSVLAEYNTEIVNLIQRKCDPEAPDITKFPCQRAILRSTMRSPKTLTHCGDQSYTDTILCHECHASFKTVETGENAVEDQKQGLWQKIKNYSSSHPKTVALGIGVAAIALGGAAYALHSHSTMASSKASTQDKVTTVAPTTESTTTAAPTTTTTAPTTTAPTTAAPTTTAPTTAAPTTTIATTESTTTAAPTTTIATTESTTTAAPTTTIATTTIEPSREGVNQIKIKFRNHSSRPVNATYEICNEENSCVTHQYNSTKYSTAEYTFDLKNDFSKMLGTVNYTRNGNDEAASGITQREKDITWNRHEFISNNTIDELDKYTHGNLTGIINLSHFIVDGDNQKVHLNERFETEAGLPEVAEVTEYYKTLYVHSGWYHLTPHITVERKNGGTNGFKKVKSDYKPRNDPFSSGVPSASEEVRVTAGSVYGYYTPMKMTGEQLNKMRLENSGKNDICFTASRNYHEVKKGDKYYAGTAGSTYLDGPTAAYNQTDCKKTK